MGRPKKIALCTLDAGDKFYMVDEPSFFPYIVIRQVNNRTIVEKPSGQKDYYNSDIIVKKLTPKSANKNKER